VLGDFKGKVPYFIEIPGTIGIATGIADVDQILVGHEVDECTGHSEAAETAVEHADRPGIHSLRVLPDSTSIGRV
jgi:hypothetical protein